MTDNEIIKALGRCSNSSNGCYGCPLFSSAWDKYGKSIAKCEEELIRYALDLINRQKAEIERYRKTVGKLAVKDGEVVGLIDGKETAYIEKSVAETLRRIAIKTARAEAIKEFAERVESGFDRIETNRWMNGSAIKTRIDDLVKEMTEETT